MAEDKNKNNSRKNSTPEEKQFDERVVHIDRVARVVKGGRRFRFRALVVVGDHKGKVGIGISKGADVTAAVAKAVDVAKKNFNDLKLYKGTFPHEAQAKVGGSVILLKPASVGTGLIAGGVVRTVLEVAGVSNALSKSLGSTNKINTAYATIEALKQMEYAKDWITTKYNNDKKKAAGAKTEIKLADKSVGTKKVETKKPVVKESAKSKTKTTKSSAKKETKK